MQIKKIGFGDEGQVATAELLAGLSAFRARAVAMSPGLAQALDRTRRGIDTLAVLDRQHGGSGRIALEGIEELLDAILADLARVEAELLRVVQQGLGTGSGDRHQNPSPEPVPEDVSEPLGVSLSSPGLLLELADFVVGVAIWAVRHDVQMQAVEPVVNALAHRANAARTKQELAAVFGLTQGLLAHVATRLGADLERSNPERPWRLLHANLAITAIRTEDAAMIDHAFDALDAALPDDRAAFYAEALALALAPGIAPAVRERIEARHLKWTAAH